MFRGRVSADGQRAMHAADRRHHDDVPRPLLPHDGNDSFCYRDGGEKVGLELAADLAEFEVLGEAGQGESCIIDEDIDASMLADDVLDEPSDEIEIVDVEPADIDVGAHARRAGGL